ncbi:hypothetical protein BgiMline_006634, partial [Biomphalaria glabrata]
GDYLQVQCSLGKQIVGFGCHDLIEYRRIRYSSDYGFYFEDENIVKLVKVKKEYVLQNVLLQ